MYIFFRISNSFIRNNKTNFLNTLLVLWIDFKRLNNLILSGKKYKEFWVSTFNKRFKRCGWKNP